MQQSPNFIKRIPGACWRGTAGPLLPTASGALGDRSISRSLGEWGCHHPFSSPSCPAQHCFAIRVCCRGGTAVACTYRGRGLIVVQEGDILGGGPSPTGAEGCTRAPRPAPRQHWRVRRKFRERFVNVSHAYCQRLPPGDVTLSLPPSLPPICQPRRKLPDWHKRGCGQVGYRPGTIHLFPTRHVYYAALRTLLAQSLPYTAPSTC